MDVSNLFWRRRSLSPPKVPPSPRIQAKNGGGLKNVTEVGGGLNTVTDSPGQDPSLFIRCVSLLRRSSSSLSSFLLWSSLSRSGSFNTDSSTDPSSSFGRGSASSPMPSTPRIMNDSEGLRTLSDPGDISSSRIKHPNLLTRSSSLLSSSASSPSVASSLCPSSTSSAASSSIGLHSSSSPSSTSTMPSSSLTSSSSVVPELSSLVSEGSSSSASASGSSSERPMYPVGSISYATLILGEEAGGGRIRPRPPIRRRRRTIKKTYPLVIPLRAWFLKREYVDGRLIIRQVRIIDQENNYRAYANDPDNNFALDDDDDQPTDNANVKVADVPSVYQHQDRLRGMRRSASSPNLPRSAERDY